MEKGEQWRWGKREEKGVKRRRERGNREKENERGEKWN
jgi:hypothetical protein